MVLIGVRLGSSDRTANKLDHSGVRAPSGDKSEPKIYSKQTQPYGIPCKVCTLLSSVSPYAGLDENGSVLVKQPVSNEVCAIIARLGS